ncbi:hypothetical protein GQ42DRAFT_164676 [Ramicandelaber brevisporus]|nr:hypothetical protein GQ42DRAFT_164676 [Ramicandelaber brevisporus]
MNIVSRCLSKLKPPASLATHRISERTRTPVKRWTLESEDTTQCIKVLLSSDDRLCARKLRICAGSICTAIERDLEDSIPPRILVESRVSEALSRAVCLCQDSGRTDLVRRVKKVLARLRRWSY